MEEIANELSHLDPQRFEGLLRKAVRDRIHLLMKQHNHRNDFARKQQVRVRTGRCGVKIRPVLNVLRAVVRVRRVSLDS